MLTFLKLGGSLITDKTQPRTPRPEVLARLMAEIAAVNAIELARLAWHLGNRHADVQVVGERLRIRRDHVLAVMLEGLGAQVTSIEAPFDPESGAYDFRPHEHERDA